MAQTKTASIVVEALSVALEKMAFLDVVAAEASAPHPHVVITAEIHFAGPVTGILRIASGIEFACVLAENMAVVDELTEHQCIDAMKELVNVTCGLILPMLSTSETDVFDVTVPDLTRSEEREHWEQFLQEPDAVAVDVEQHPVAARLILEKAD